MGSSLDKLIKHGRRQKGIFKHEALIQEWASQASGDITKTKDTSTHDHSKVKSSKCKTTKLGSPITPISNLQTSPLESLEPLRKLSQEHHRQDVTPTHDSLDGGTLSSFSMHETPQALPPLSNPPSSTQATSQFILTSPVTQVNPISSKSQSQTIPPCLSKVPAPPPPPNPMASSSLPTDPSSGPVTSRVGRADLLASIQGKGIHTLKKSRSGPNRRSGGILNKSGGSGSSSLAESLAAALDKCLSNIKDDKDEEGDGKNDEWD